MKQVKKTLADYAKRGSKVEIKEPPRYVYITSGGAFLTMKEAADFHDISEATVSQRISNVTDKWPSWGRVIRNW